MEDNSEKNNIIEDDYEYINQGDYINIKKKYDNIRMIDNDDIKIYKEEFECIQENSIITPTKAISYFSTNNNVSLIELSNLYSLINKDLNTSLSFEDFVYF